LARHQFDCRGSCLGGPHRIDPLCAMTAVLGAVGGIDRVVEDGVGIHKSDVSVDAASLDVAFAAHSSAAVPGGAAPVTGSDVKVVAMADDPDRHRLAPRAGAPQRGAPQFLCPAHLIEFVAGPCRHYPPPLLFAP